MVPPHRSDVAGDLRLVDSLLTAITANLSSLERLLAEVHHEVERIRGREETEAEEEDEERAALRREVMQLREALISRALIERAKGILMNAGGLTETESFALLNELSQRRRRKLRDLAADIADGRLSPAAVVLPAPPAPAPGTATATGSASGS